MKALAALLLALAPPGAQALGVTCITSSTGLAFGIYNPVQSTPTDSTGQVSVQCSGLLGLLVSYSISLSAGGSGSASARRMSGSGGSLGYNVYTDAAHSALWGDGSGGTSTVADGYLLSIGTVTRNYTAYGRIPARQVVRAGAYADGITITVSY